MNGKLVQNPSVETVIGDTAWADYEVNVNVSITENTGSAKIMGRVMEVHRGNDYPEGYWFKITTGNNWTLNAGSQKLASGRADFPPFTWHNLLMRFNGNKITVLVNNKEVASVTDTQFTHGLAGLGSDFNFAEFDDFEIKQIHITDRQPFKHIIKFKQILFMKNILIIILLILVFQHISGQDIITTKDKKQLNVKIIEQTDKSVRYKMPDYEDSPVIMMKTNHIRKIEYKNGHTDLMGFQNPRKNRPLGISAGYAASMSGGGDTGSGNAGLFRFTSDRYRDKHRNVRSFR